MIPELPPNPTPEQVSAWRRQLLKQYAPALMVAPVMLIAVPIINVHAEEYDVIIGLAVTLPLVVAVARGAQCMIEGHEDPGAGFEVFLGAAAASLALLAAPYSAQVSLANFAEHPGWIFMSVGGAVALAGYLHFALKRWLRK